MEMRLESVETTWRREGVVEAQDVSDNEAEFEPPHEEGEANKDHRKQIINAITNLRGKPKMEVATYFGSLGPKELIEQIRDMEKFFDME